MRAFGDSITRGGAVLMPFPTLVATAKTWSVANHGIDGAQAADCADSAYGNAVGSGDVSLFAAGENDQRTAGGDAVKLSLFGLIHQALVAFRAIPCSAKILANSSGVTYTGNWSTGLWGFGKYSNEQNATASFSFTGATVYVAMVFSDNWNGVYSLKVDGVVQAAGSSAGNGKIATTLGRCYAPYLMRLSGFSSGNHTVELKITSPTSAINYVAFDWAAVPNSGAKVYVGEIGKSTTAGYAQYGGSDSNVDLFNKTVGQNVSVLSEDGLNVHIVHSPTLADVDLADGLHPTQSGYKKIANSFLSVINNFG